MDNYVINMKKTLENFNKISKKSVFSKKLNNIVVFHFRPHGDSESYSTSQDLLYKMPQACSVIGRSSCYKMILDWQGLKIINDFSKT